MTTVTGTILIVDDQENNRLVIEDILRRFKCTVLHADSGEQALARLEEMIPDLILMDQMMPGLSGIETIERIKQDPRYEHLPILMVTAKDKMDTLKEAFAAGAVDYIIKPVEKISLMARVHSALRTKYAFDEIKQLTQQLIAQKKELTNFTSMVSHDLKSPLASSVSLFDFFLYRMREDHPDILDEEGLGELVLRIPKSLHKMLSFIDTLLNYATAGKVVGDLEVLEMGLVVGDVLSEFHHVAEEGIATFESHNLWPEVEGDSTKLRQVWQNLISNAIKYRGEQTPVHIKVGCEEHEETYSFWVQDNGPGIPVELHQDIFQPFTRASVDEEGHGIGLATVSQIIKAHYGSIEIDPDVEEGAKFVFHLPKH